MANTLRTFIPGEIVRFRFAGIPASFVVIACDGILVTVTDGRETFDLPIGELRR
jgi:hypothetical protein